MSDSVQFQFATRTVTLHAYGIIYGSFLTAGLMWTGMALLLYFALHADHSIEKGTRFRKAFLRNSEWEPKASTERALISILFVDVAAFVCITSYYNISDMPWDGWVFVQHTIAACIALIAASALMIFWYRRLPVGLTFYQGCYHCFYRVPEFSWRR